MLRRTYSLGNVRPLLKVLGDILGDYTRISTPIHRTLYVIQTLQTSGIPGVENG